MGPETYLRQELTDRAMVEVGRIGGRLLKEARGHIHLPTRRERHLQLPNNIESQMSADPTQFAGA